MKKPPLSATQFDQLTPDALDPNGFEVDNEPDWPAWAAGSGVASGVALILVFLDFHYADQIFKGRSYELVQNMSYCLIAATLGLGLFSAYAFIKTLAQKNKTEKDTGQRQSNR